MDFFNNVREVWQALVGTSNDANVNGTASNNMTDRMLGVLVAFLLFASILAVFVNFSFSLAWFFLLVWTVVLGIWAASGIKTVDIGWRGQLLYFGARQSPTFKEGLRWIPAPFGLKTADCRKQTLTFEVLDATTVDNVQVFVGGSVVYRVVDLNMYFDAEKTDLEKWIDNTRKQVIRTRVRTLKQAEVLDAHESLGGEMVLALRKEDSTRWGVEIIEVIIPEISPDPEVAKDLALQERENLQRKGQTVEISHFEEMVKKLMRPKPRGVGLSREQAIEQVQLALGKASKTIDAKTIALDSATAGIITTVLGRK